MRLFSSQYELFDAQLEIMRSPARFLNICTGRRFGKTLLATKGIVRRAMEDVGDYGWIAPTHEVSKRGIDAMRKIVNPRAFDIRGNPSVGYMSNGSRIFFGSSDNKDATAMLGHGLKGIVLDEAARVSVESWQISLRPTLADNQGWCWKFSTPRAHNWFYDDHTRGVDPGYPEYASFSFPSLASPFFPKEEWDLLQRSMPRDVFRQEYEAVFLEDGAGCFRGIDACIRPATCGCAKGSAYALGCDLAKHTDYTVLLALCRKCGMVKAFDRFNKVEWPVQKARIAAFVKRYPGKLYLDATGIGDPIYDDLRAAGLRLEGVKFTTTSKPSLVQNLMLALEQEEIGLLDSEHRVIIDELRRYEYSYKAGSLSYSAPSGYHDDTVMALALAVKGLQHHMPAMVMV